MTASRRRFLRLVAAGSAAVVAGPVAAAVRKAPRAKKPAPAKPAAAAPATTLAEELRKQKASLEQSLKALRDYPLPAGGGEPGFTFVPLKARRKERAS